jgi:hypothetical protein
MLEAHNQICVNPRLSAVRFLFVLCDLSRRFRTVFL